MLHQHYAGHVLDGRASSGDAHPTTDRDRPFSQSGQPPKVAVISACFNHGRFVPEMLESVWSQTLPAHEVIVVNDGSTDDTARILSRLRHSSLRIIHTPNRGPSAARNTAISATDAPLILNLDADDRIAPTYLQKATDAMTSDPGLGIAYGDVRFFGTRSDAFDLPPYSLAEMLRDNVIVSAAVFRRADWETVGGYAQELIHGTEDYDLWLSIIGLGRGVYRIPEEMVFYRTHPLDQASRSARRLRSRRRVIHSKCTMFWRHEALYMQCPEEYARMNALIERWQNERLPTRWVKSAVNTYRYLRSTSGL